LAGKLRGPILVLRAQAAGAVQVRLGNSRARVAQNEQPGSFRRWPVVVVAVPTIGRDVRSPNLVL